MTQESTVLTDIAGYRDALELLEPADSEAEAIDRIRQLEELKATCAALQAEEAAALRVLRERHEAERGVAKARRCKGLAAEIGLARRESPNRGAQHLRLAQALVEDLPHTKRALRAGKIREEHAQVVVRETAWLEPAERQEVDGLLVDALGAVGVRKLEAQARAHAQRIDQAGAVQRLARAHAQRRVSVRPTAENMAYVTALLPMQQAVGVYASLRRDATTMVGTGETADPVDPTCSPRTRDQIMADLFVERTTGQVTAAAVPAEVHVVMTDATLFGDSAMPAWLTGHGPIPARAVKQWLADPQMKVFLRRILARPEDHQLVRLESRSRLFPSGLRRMVMLRDDRCRAPFCDAPIQDIDHMHPVKNGGATSYQNASGLCARCNQTKENNLGVTVAVRIGLQSPRPPGTHIHLRRRDFSPAVLPVPAHLMTKAPSRGLVLMKIHRSRGLPIRKAIADLHSCSIAASLAQRACYEAVRWVRPRWHSAHRPPA